MSRARRVMLIVVALLLVVGVLGGIKVLQIRKMIASAAALGPPPEAITTATARKMEWTPIISAVGSLEAVQGVTVAAELPGRIVQIAFQPGAKVKKGDLLLRQDVSAEQAQLHTAAARLGQLRTNLHRTRRLYASNVVAAARLDDAEAETAQASGEAAAVRASIRKKTIRAPFAGRLGIRLVNLGQVVSSGTPIVSLQAIDPVYANFSVPQQQLPRLRTGLPVRIRAGRQATEIQGTITTINPHVTSSTRNVEVQATLKNPGERLRPGMFAEVEVRLPSRGEVLAIPSTAVLHAPYGDSVFIVEQPRRTEAGSAPGATHVVRQQFVRLGERRGDFVVVTGGLKEGERVAATGAFKLRNGQPVVVKDALSPRFKLTPKPSDG